nr:acyltransferase [Serratia nevei]
MNSVTRLDALTALRFFAAAMIVIGHGHALFGSLGIATNFSLSQGVSFFFTLSGFILAYNYRSLPDMKSVKRFIVARFARIWPLHIATLIIWLALITPNITHDLNPSIDTIAKLIINTTLLQSWSFTAPWILSFNGVAWSISTEAFFYIVFAFISINYKKAFPIAIMLSLISLATFIFIATKLDLSQADGTPGFTMFSVLYTNPVVRIFEFLFGVFCAKLFFKSKDLTIKISCAKWLFLELLSIAMSIYAVYIAARPSLIYDSLGSGASYYFYKSGIWLAWGFLILTFALSSGPISKMLSIKPMIFLGEISFALYLVHMIIFNIFYYNYERVEALGIAGVFIFWFVCIASSSILHILIEKPCRKFIMKYWDGRNGN